MKEVEETGKVDDTRGIAVPKMNLKRGTVNAGAGCFAAHATVYAEGASLEAPTGRPSRA